MASGPVSFGNPQFGKQVQDAFPKFFEVIPRATESFNDLANNRHDEDVEPCSRAVLNLALLSGISMWELVTLVGNGFGLGAMKIARTMLEAAINAEYLRLTPNEFDDYLEWHWVEQHKLLTFVRENLPDSFVRLPVNDVERIEKGFGEAKTRFERADGELRRSWCKLDLGARASKAGFALEFKLINPVSSQLIHGTFGGLAQHFNVTKDLDRLAVPPSMTWCAQALIGAHVCLLKVIDTLSKTFALQPCYPVPTLFQEFEHAWGAGPDEAIAQAARD